MSTDPGSSPAHKHIILCGFMGTGKSTVGRMLAARLEWPFVDTDAFIERRRGRTISQIFIEDGEPAFRALEHALCAEIAQWRPTVIATGGGMILPAENRAALQACGMLICLDATPETILRRLKGQTHRPLLQGHDPAGRIAELMAARAAAYRAVPYHVVTDERPPGHVVGQIMALWQP